MNFKLLPPITILILLSGCTSTPKYTISNNWDKTKLSKLYIYRTNVSYHSLNPEKPFFYIDGKKIGKLGTGQYIFTLINSGNHTVVVKEPILFMPAYESDNLKFTAKPNKEYYIRYSKDFTGIFITGSTAISSGKTALQMSNREYYLKRK